MQHTTGNSITRRQFLKRAGVVAAAAPFIIPSSVLGADKLASANNRITLGFIGVGGMGGGHLKNHLGNSQVQVLAVCEVDATRREAARKRVNDHYGKQKRSGTYKDCAVYDDFRELLARDDIDAVVIATPDHWHAIIAIQAAKAGKDIYCEKPLTLTIREARAIVKAVRRYGRVFQTGSQQRSKDNFRRACELVRSGHIGDVRTVHVSVGGPSSEQYLPAQPVPPGLDWDFWLGPAPWRPYNEKLHPFKWRGHRDYSGGAMTDWGAHHFDIAQWGLGMDESGPVEAHPPDGKQHKLLTYTYASGVRMFHVPKKGTVNGVLFTGTEGKIEVNRSYFRTWPEKLRTAPLGPNDVHLYKSPDHRKDWLECIRSRKKPICDVETGCRSITVCHLGNLAYWLKRPIRWDPAKEQIIGDDEATRWLDRPKRAPWRL